MTSTPSCLDDVTSVKRDVAPVEVVSLHVLLLLVRRRDVTTTPSSEVPGC